MKLLEIKRADVKDKKWSAFFQVGDKIKKINFGAKGYGDYTLGTTDTQRKNYLAIGPGNVPLSNFSILRTK